MKEILETAMLVCFGLSWPTTLIKNIREKSAKAMNIYFIMLIFIGYIAGISAKLIERELNFVVAVYLLNLIVVFGNIIVYFINKKFDKAKLKQGGNFNEEEN